MLDKLTCSLLCLLVILLPSCSLFRTSTQGVTISASDPLADIYADGILIGKGTATAQLKRNETHTFMAKTDDGRAGTNQVGRSLSGTAMLDIVGGIFFLVPLLGLFGPGAWDLDSTNVQIAVPTK